MKIQLLTLLALSLGLAAVVAQPVITNQPQNQTAIAGATTGPPFGLRRHDAAFPSHLANNEHPRIVRHA